ncbi:hypothetical protein ANCDUO_24499, partial [Ancylostoma duodenale]
WIKLGNVACRRGAATSRLRRLYSGRIFVAEQEEVNKICEEYQKVEDKYGLFERMFIQLFLEEEVELSVHFGLDNLKEDELRKDQRFRTHVGKFQRFLTGILEMLSKGPEQAENIVQVLSFAEESEKSWVDAAENPGRNPLIP